MQHKIYHIAIRLSCHIPCIQFRHLTAVLKALQQGAFPHSVVKLDRVLAARDAFEYRCAKPVDLTHRACHQKFCLTLQIAAQRGGDLQLDGRFFTVLLLQGLKEDFLYLLRRMICVPDDMGFTDLILRNCHKFFRHPFSDKMKAGISHSNITMVPDTVNTEAYPNMLHLAIQTALYQLARNPQLYQQQLIGFCNSFAYCSAFYQCAIGSLSMGRYAVISNRSCQPVIDSLRFFKGSCCGRNSQLFQNHVCLPVKLLHMRCCQCIGRHDTIVPIPIPFKMAQLGIVQQNLVQCAIDFLCRCFQARNRALHRLQTTV